MPVTTLTSLTIGWAAMVTGVAGLLALVFIILFFTVNQFFGTLNDISIGLAAILSGVLAWLLYSRSLSGSPLQGQAALLAALAGALIVLVGCGLVIFKIKGWYLAGLYMAAGNALIGLWLFALCSSALSASNMPHGLAIYGIIAGLVMALGLAAIPGIFKGLDARDAAPWYVNYIDQASALGYLVLYPLWCLWLGWILLVR
jgi:hypothetical protein